VTKFDLYVGHFVLEGGLRERNSYFGHVPCLDLEFPIMQAKSATQRQIPQDEILTFLFFRTSFISVVKSVILNILFIRTAFMGPSVLFLIFFIF